MNHTTPVTSSQPFYGWTVVWAAFIIAMFGWGLGFYGPPIYLKAVQDSRGWSVGTVSSAITVHYLFGALVAANLPRAYARFGLSLVTTGGAVALGFGVVGWAIALEPWQLFAATLLSGAGWVALSAIGVNAIISPWFVHRRPAALSMAYNGASVGGIVFSPLWVLLIDTLGFASAAAAVAVAMMAIIAAIAAVVLTRTPEAMGQHPDGDAPMTGAANPRAAPHRKVVARFWSDGAFITLTLGMAIGLFAQIGLVSHLFSLLVPALGSKGAGFAMAMATIGAIAGRTLTGWFMPAGAERRVVAAMNYVMQAAGCGLLIVADGANVPLLLAGTLLIGLGIGNSTSIPPLIAQMEFTPAQTGRAVALVVACAQATYAFAPAALGLIREFTSVPGSGAAPLLFVTAIAAQLTAAIAYIAGRGLFQKR